MTCYSFTVVQWYNGTVLQLYSGTVVQWYSVTVVQCYSGTVVKSDKHFIPDKVVLHGLHSLTKA